MYDSSFVMCSHVHAFLSAARLMVPFASFDACALSTYLSCVSRFVVLPCSVVAVDV